METKFYYCPICGNLVLSVVDSGQVPMCCGQKMKVPEPNTTDGKVEAHMPKVTCQQVDGKEKPVYNVDVCVGSMPHPMTPEHHIDFIFMASESGGQLKHLNPDHPAVAHFVTCSPPVAVFAYCNLHGLWRAIPVMAHCSTKDQTGCK